MATTLRRARTISTRIGRQIWIWYDDAHQIHYGVAVRGTKIKLRAIVCGQEIIRFSPQTGV